MFDTGELRSLVADLGKIPAATFPAVEKVVDEHGEKLRERWASNASATAGDHGKHYPRSITAQIKPGLGTIGVEVGPESGKPQGGMGKGFEYGSRNQPPHMDGNRAADALEPEFAAALPKLLSDLLGKAL